MVTLQNRRKAFQPVASSGVTGARYWRIQVLTDWGGGYIALRELEFCNASNVRIAGTLTTSFGFVFGTASRWYDGHYAENEGNAYSAYTNSHINGYITLDAGAGNTVLVNSFRQYMWDTESQQIKNTIIQYSSDNSNWTTAASNIQMNKVIGSTNMWSSYTNF